MTQQLYAQLVDDGGSDEVLGYSVCARALARLTGNTQITFSREQFMERMITKGFVCAP